MAHKTFISYKYSESVLLRDKIIESLKSDVQYYKGEDANSKDVSDTSNDNIRSILKDKIYDTSVMIVIISPNMKNSEWIEWEIAYALKDIKHHDKTSHSNGIVGVIQNIGGNTNWLSKSYKHPDGHTTTIYDTSKLLKIISENRFNQKQKIFYCENCMSVDSLEGSYISLVNENDFLNNPNKYIENAYEKSQNLDDYNIIKATSDNLTYGGISDLI